MLGPDAYPDATGAFAHMLGNRLDAIMAGCATADTGTYAAELDVELVMDECHVFERYLIIVHHRLYRFAAQVHEGLRFDGDHFGLAHLSHYHFALQRALCGPVA